MHWVGVVLIWGGWGDTLGWGCVDMEAGGLGGRIGVVLIWGGWGGVGLGSC